VFIRGIRGQKPGVIMVPAKLTALADVSRRLCFPSLARNRGNNPWVASRTGDVNNLELSKTQDAV
jgi:hypothetical protein